LVYISVTDSMGLTSTTVLCRNWPRATEFSKITQNNGHHAVQAHSWSPISVSMKSHYATVTYLLSPVPFPRWRIIDPIFLALNRGCLSVTHSFGV